MIPSTERLTLSESLSELRTLIEVIDQVSDGEATEETEALLESVAPQWNRAMENFKAKIDARVSLLDYLDLVEQKIASDVASLNAKKKAAVAIAARVKEQTKLFMEQNPDLDFRGSIKSFAIQANGGSQPIEYAVELQSLSNIVDPSDLDKFPGGYIKEFRLFVLDKSAYETAVRAGFNAGSAARLLPRGSHLRRR